MRDRRSRLWVGIGLVALCSGLTLAGWQPVEAQTVDVLSLPGDAPGSKVAFHRNLDVLAADGEQGEQAKFDFPGASEVRIETVTARCELPATQTVSVGILTFVDSPNPLGVVHWIALTRAGTFLKSGTQRARDAGTHYVRLLDNSKSAFEVLVIRDGDNSGDMLCSVTVSGYTTPGGRKRP